MTSKAGQKCTAIRRMIVPKAVEGDVIEALKTKLAKTVIGDPGTEGVRMGPLASQAQRRDVMEKVAVIGSEAECVYGDPKAFTVEGADAQKGAFMPPMLFHCADPAGASRIHETEAFGPVSTVMAYDTLDDAVSLANRGGGSLVMSLITHDPAVARDVARGAGAWHGRIYINDRDSMGESTGHGSPLPHLTHGGPGRAGGGEEMGGVRGVFHYMQRSSVQGSPDMLGAVAGTFVPGSKTFEADRHPFTKCFEDLQLGETLHTKSREVTLEDIEHFAEFTGDTFYAHMDEEAAKANPFFPGRVAHGYLLLSFAAGLFVEPSPGPVLANVGLEGLKFMKPVSPGDSIKVALTVKRKTKRTDTYGEVRWHVVLTNQDDETVAEYELHTMNAYANTA
jgi:oxepin-CoA hydrolase/3-oxo-5,6-dehydrosuberyl-CoA semialdehyde dehydrogenase